MDEASSPGICLVTLLPSFWEIALVVCGVSNTPWTQLVMWAVKCPCSRSNNQTRLRLPNSEMWGLDSPGSHCWHCFQALCSSTISSAWKKKTRKHCGKGDRNFSNPVHSALWLLRYTAADCYSSQSWGHEWGFCLESVQRRAEAGSYRASRGNHRGKTCLKGEIKNSLGRECVYMWHDMYLLSWSAELLPKQSWKLSENGGFF